MSEDKPVVVLVDLSSIAHQIYHISASEPDPDYTSKQTVTRVHALASGHDHVAVCCDSGRSFRRDVSADYKANRPERDEILMHQIALVREQLEADGFPVWAAEGYEADDLLASACADVRAAGHPVLIVTGDKDILCLVTDEVPAVTVKSVQTGAVLDTEGVVNKLGVLPAQMVDYLSLVGDTSDNIKGAKGIGPKGAAALLKRFGTLDDLFHDWDETGPGSLGLTPAVVASLQELRGRLTTVRALITLRRDVLVPVGDVLTARVPPPMAGDEPKQEDAVPEDYVEEALAGMVSKGLPLRMPALDVPASVQRIPDEAAKAFSDAMIPVRQQSQATARVVDAEAVPYERQLDPTSSASAVTLAQHMFRSRVFNAGSEQDALARILAGREMGLPAVTSLRLIRIIEGNMSMPAQLIVAQVLKSGFAKYFRVTERTNEAATFETQRGDDPPVSLRFTVEDGKRAFPGDEKAWAKSGWGRNPADMCVARASSKLARLVYPDVCANVYSPEEIAEMRESNRG